jgi:hypothetical protein
MNGRERSTRTNLFIFIVFTLFMGCMWFVVSKSDEYMIATCKKLDADRIVFITTGKFLCVKNNLIVGGTPIKEIQ